ncbi:MAG: hypothetical protein GY821_05660 [Gammaproteobacteria bacterium]|nr:hypothetical protein [Gammaproteobacteria bacterium]
MTIFKITPQSIIFSGFSSEGFWLIFSGVAIGASIKQSGLSVRISALLMQYGLCRLTGNFL